jgi:hypothetical protein
VAAGALRVVSGEADVQAASLSFRGIVGRLDFTFLSLKARELVRQAVNFLGRSRSHRQEAEEAMRLSAPDVSLEAADALRARAGTVDLKAEGAARLDGSIVRLG